MNKLLKGVWIAAALSMPLSGQADWSIKTIGIVGSSGSVNGINDAGQVVGSYRAANDFLHAFVTGPNGEGINDLSTQIGDYFSYSYGINNSGQVVGFVQGRGFITEHNGENVTYVSNLMGDSYYSYATDINDAGQVVGRATSTDGRYHAFVTGSDGVGMTDLGIFGTGNFSTATAINNAGQIVGYSHTTVSDGLDTLNRGHAFLAESNGAGITDLGTLGGRKYSIANDVNDSGQAVGFSYSTYGNYFAFITAEDGANMTYLGTLGGDYSVAHGINNAGQVVGWSYTSDNLLHGFFYNQGAMTDLSVLDIVLAAGWTNIIPQHINNNGQIVGTGILDNVEQAFMISFNPDTDFNSQPVHLPVPEPETYAMLLVGLGFIGFMARRKKFNG